MSLRDADVLELNDLCSALVDDTISRLEMRRLEEWIAASTDARQFYIRAMDQSASLAHYASEMQIEAPDLRRRAGSLVLPGIWIGLALAASVVVAGAIALLPPDATDLLRQTDEYVAKITGVKNCGWSGSRQGSKLGTFLTRGQHLELLTGFAEVTFDSGAVMVVEAPATLEVNSAWDATLQWGTVTVNVPPQAAGFRVSNPVVEIVDLGTQFSMVADGHGTADVFVIRGEVEAASLSGRDGESILLKANESRRFAMTGDSGVGFAESAAARANVPVAFDRISDSPCFVHWSFDDTTGPEFGGLTGGLLPSECALLLKKRRAKTALVAGFRQHGVQFDGRNFAKGQYPGLSSNLPRTVAYWVNVPKDAALSEAYAMVAWRADGAKLNSRPVHICWNRNPDEGPIGALRTDFSGGHAMGMTSLRDGQWHYVSVVFVPGVGPDTPVQVKQYLDGRLESNRVTVGPRLSIAANRSDSEDGSLTDAFWLGCRIGSGGPRKARFRGKIDELVITDCSLDPSEIARLMDGQSMADLNR